MISLKIRISVNTGPTCLLSNDWHLRQGVYSQVRHSPHHSLLLPDEIKWQLLSTVDVCYFFLIIIMILICITCLDPGPGI